MKRVAQLILVVLALIFVVSQPLSAAGPWEGRIIDIETKEPLEGAVVVAVWSRAWLTPTGTVSDVYEVREAVTEKNGQFKIPAYIPINLLPIITYITEPEFIIYKPGYGSLEMAIGDYLTGEKNKEPFSGNMLFYDIKVSPGVIELQRLKTKEERLKAIPGRPGGTSSEDFYLLYKAINEERKNFGLGAVGTVNK